MQSNSIWTDSGQIMLESCAGADNFMGGQILSMLFNNNKCEYNSTCKKVAASFLPKIVLFHKNGIANRRSIGNTKALWWTQSKTGWKI